MGKREEQNTSSISFDPTDFGSDRKKISRRLISFLLGALGMQCLLAQVHALFVTIHSSTF